MIQVIKSRMRLAGHLALVGEAKCIQGFWWGNLREGDPLKDPGVDGRIILQWIKKWHGLDGSAS